MMLEGALIRKPTLPPVLILGDHLGYPDGVAHGVTIYFLNVLPELVRAGVDITVCFLREPHPAAAELRKAGIEPIFLSAHPADPFVVLRVASIARERGCRIIHAGGIKGTLAARVVAPLIGAKTIVHVHDLHYPNRLVSALHWLFSQRGDIGLCVSRAVEEVVEKGYHVPRERLRVAYNGIRPERIQNVAPDARSRLRGALGISSSRQVIAMIGRMYPVKGHRGMMEIMHRIVKVCPAADLLLVGDGPERPACEAMVEQLGLQGRVHFIGHRDDIPELLATADIVAMPSLLEGLGLAAIEALVAGVPVVAYNIGGLGEVVTDGVDGRLVPLNDHAAFAAAAIELLQNPELRKAYGERAKRAAERFSLDHHIEVLLKCYGEVAGDNPTLAPVYR